MVRVDGWRRDRRGRGEGVAHQGSCVETPISLLARQVSKGLFRTVLHESCRAINYLALPPPCDDTRFGQAARGSVSV